MRLYLDASAIIYSVESVPSLRARDNLKTPDAIHVATAIQEKVDVLLTGDAALTRCPDVNVEVL